MGDNFFADALKDILEKAKEPGREEEYKQWEEAQKQLRITSLFNTSGLPDLFKQKNFSNFTITKENKEAHQRCYDYVMNWEVSKIPGIALFGSVGVGKSHLAAAVVSTLINRYQVSARYANVLHTFEKIRWSYDPNSDEKNPLPALLDCFFLVLDDLGSERPTPWALEQISHIIDYRMSENLPLMITSNVGSLQGLANILDISGDSSIVVSRIIDRIKVMVGFPVKIIGKSWR